jgi:hypothetical protein
MMPCIRVQCQLPHPAQRCLRKRKREDGKRRWFIGQTPIFTIQPGSRWYLTQASAAYMISRSLGSLLDSRWLWRTLGNSYHFNTICDYWRRRLPFLGGDQYTRYPRSASLVLILLLLSKPLLLGTLSTQSCNSGLFGSTIRPLHVSLARQLVNFACLTFTSFCCERQRASQHHVGRGRKLRWSPSHH